MEAFGMRRSGGLTGLTAAWMVGVATLVGCGNAPTGGEDAKSSATAQAADPATTVQTFLEGARTGDDEKVTSMLTPVARTELAKKQLWVAPARSDTAKFEVGEVRYPAEGVAHVASRWIEVEPTSRQAVPTEMTWVLRKEAEGWRVGGMAMVVFKDEPPLLLNFEQPDDMLHQKQLLQAEIAKRAAQTNSASAVAEKPEDSAQR
jgi:hypothetical protein